MSRTKLTIGNIPDDMKTSFIRAHIQGITIGEAYLRGLSEAMDEDGFFLFKTGSGYDALEYWDDEGLRNIIVVWDDEELIEFMKILIDGKSVATGFHPVFDYCGTGPVIIGFHQVFNNDGNCLSEEYISIGGTTKEKENE